MIQKCLVTINNEAVTVVKYGEGFIQLPSIHKEAEYVFVEEKNGRYSVVDEPKQIDEIPVEKKEEKETTKKKSTKKTKK